MSAAGLAAVELQASRSHTLAGMIASAAQNLGPDRFCPAANQRRPGPERKKKAMQGRHAVANRCSVHGRDG